MSETKKITDLLPEAVQVLQNYMAKENIELMALALGYMEKIEEPTEKIEKRTVLDENWEEKEIEVSVFENILKENPEKIEEFVVKKIFENLLFFIKEHSKNGSNIEFEKKINKQIEKIL